MFVFFPSRSFIYFADCIRTNDTWREKVEDEYDISIERIVRAIHPMTAEKLLETNYLISQPTPNFQEKPLLCPRMSRMGHGLCFDSRAGALVHFSGQRSQPRL